MATSPLKSKKNVELILTPIFLVLFIWFGWKAFYELFVNNHAVHYARINFNGEGDSVIHWNFPTIASIIIFISSLSGIGASMMIIINSIFCKVKKNRAWWTVLITGFSISLLALIFWIFDFMGSAFGGVG